MAGKRNYQKEMERVLSKIREEGRKPKLMLHSCCAPCSSYVLEYLSEYFEITIFYYNPNIEPEKEYLFRLSEQERLSAEMPGLCVSEVIAGEYEPEKYHEVISGLEDEPEGGKRCTECFRMRLERTARAAALKECDFFTTTLTVSPHKNASVLNAVGEETAEEFGVPFLNSDFKKKNGYKRSIELSKEYGLYRQDYCGCVYSRRGNGLKNT